MMAAMSIENRRAAWLGCDGDQIEMNKTGLRLTFGGRICRFQKVSHSAVAFHVE
jgi:hypothetical protein